MAWLPFAKLEITDGTDTINLINMQSSGFCITAWEPAIQDLKAGGTWASPPTADERELIVSQLANVEEQYTFDVSAATPDELIGKLRDLRAMLEKGRQYVPTEWQDTPVDIVAQGYGETNVRYARVKNWRTPNDGFPYGPPMWDTLEGTAIEDFQIIIERGAWQENRSGVGTATEISAVETYDGRNLGNVDSAGTRQTTTANEVYRANKRNTANLTDVYIDDGGIFGANLMDAAPPYNLLPVVPAVNDAIYFGIDTSLADSGPFSSLVFDIGTAGAGYTGDWEYCTNAVGPVFTSFGVARIQDNTNGGTHAFENTGVNSVHWLTPPAWVTCTINGVTGYWARYIVKTTPGPLTSPTQQNRDIYSIIWPYIEMQSTDVLGDVPALTTIQLYNQSASGGFANNLTANRFIVGLRKISRGANYTAFINIADEQNPSGITVTPIGAAAFATDVTAPSGRVVSGNPAASLTTFARVSFDDTISTEYYGQFHLFLRAEQTGGSAGDIEIKIVGSIEGVTTFYESDTLTFSQITVVQLLDAGVVSLPPQSGLPTSEIYNEIRFDIQAVRTGAPSLALYDLVFIPVDEWAIDTKTTTSELGGAVANGNYLEVNSVIAPKVSIYSNIRYGATDNIFIPYSAITNGPCILQAGNRQRLWILDDGILASLSTKKSYFDHCTSCLVSRNQRYWSMRGTG